MSIQSCVWDAWFNSVQAAAFFRFMLMRSNKKIYNTTPIKFSRYSFSVNYVLTYHHTCNFKKFFNLIQEEAFKILLPSAKVCLLLSTLGCWPCHPPLSSNIQNPLSHPPMLQHFGASQNEIYVQISMYLKGNIFNANPFLCYFWWMN